MHPVRRAGWFLFFTALLIAPLLLLANLNGTPLGRTGAFGEPGCDGMGCHRNEPLPPGSGRLVLDVGPYVPGQSQRVQVRIFDTNARVYGFQMAARERRNPQQQAGAFQAILDDNNVRVRCANGSAAPCSAGLEYVTHTSARPRESTFAVSWLAPSSDVGEVVFTEWTSDGKIRHPSFQGLRRDKPARTVTREIAVAPPAKVPRTLGGKPAKPRTGTRARRKSKNN